MFNLSQMQNVLGEVEGNVVQTTVTRGNTLRTTPATVQSSNRVNQPPVRQQPPQVAHNVQPPFQPLLVFADYRATRVPPQQTRTQTTNVYVNPTSTASNSPHRTSTFSYQPTYNSIAQSVDNLALAIAENERRRAEQEARDREYNRLHERRDPVQGEIRYIAQEGFLGADRNRPNLEPIIDFSLRLRGNIRNAFPINNTAFWQQINECRTEQQSRDVIMEFKVEIERMINHSDLTPEYKQRFHEVLNTHTRANDISGVTAVLGVLTAVICVSLLAQASIGGYLAAAAVGGLFALYASSSLNNENSNQTRYFPTNRGAICEAGAFSRWVNNLNNVANQADAHPGRAFVNQPRY